MGLADKLKAAASPPIVFTPRPDILLHPNIPKPLHGVAPREILGRKWWDDTRQAAYASTGQHCLACSVSKYVAEGRQWLEGHELYRIDYARGISEYLETVPLCHYCHNYIHDGRLRQLLEGGQIPHAKYAAIIQHGDRVLATAGLTRPRHEERVALINDEPFAEWSKWRLLLFGKKYKPKFKSYQEWLDHWKMEDE